MAETEAPKLPPRGAPDMTAARANRARRFMVFGLVMLVAAIAGGIYWWLNRFDISTDDAFLEGDVINIAPRVDGPVVDIEFKDNQFVEKGQLLIQLDPSDYQTAVESARANLAVAEAQEHNADADLALTKQTAAAAIEEAKGALLQAQHQLSATRQQADASEADAVRAGFDAKRYEDLVKTSDASRQRYEQAVADARSSDARLKGAKSTVTAGESQVTQAQARLDDANAAPERIAMKEAQLANASAAVAQAQAALRQAELNLSYTKIYAPVSGRIAKKAVELGNVVQRGQILSDLVADTLWVVANFKETQITLMRPGQPVDVRVDALSGQRLHGHVDSFLAGSGSRFTLLPPENATGNYVKVVQRVPVKINLDGVDMATMHRLGPGMSVVPTVDVSGSGSVQAAAAK